jgi:dihydroflavonol-4-reductase
MLRRDFRGDDQPGENMPITLVTGAAGHVGATLMRALVARGQPVRALVHRDRRALAGLDVEIVEGDVQDPETLRRALAGVDLVYHAAARISISTHDRREVDVTNVAGTRNVVEACLSAGVRRLVHFSSVEALEPAPFSQPLDETRPLRSAAHCPPYACSKAAGVREVEWGLAQGLDAIILYPSAIIGPYDYRLGLSNSGLLALCTGRLFALVDGGFDWVDVRDVVEGAMRAAERAPVGEPYILSGHWASLPDLARLAHDVSGTPVPRLVAPMWLARLGAPFMSAWSRVTGGRPLYTPAALSPMYSFGRISHEKATRELDYHPRPLEESVADTWRWFECEPDPRPLEPQAVVSQ